MKNVRILSCVFLLLMSCAGKEEQFDREMLTGTWNWRVSTGGIDGRTETPVSTGSSKRLEITVNYIRGYVDGSLEFEEHYTIESGESLILEGQQQMIVFKNRMNQSYVIRGDELFLFDECLDCFQHEYARE